VSPRGPVGCDLVTPCDRATSQPLRPGEPPTGNPTTSRTSTGDNGYHLGNRFGVCPGANGLHLIAGEVVLCERSSQVAIVATWQIAVRL